MRGLGVTFPSAIPCNPLISPESRKFLATFCNELKFLEAGLEGNCSLWKETERNGNCAAGHCLSSWEGARTGVSPYVLSCPRTRASIAARVPIWRSGARAAGEALDPRCRGDSRGAGRFGGPPRGRCNRPENPPQVIEKAQNGLGTGRLRGTRKPRSVRLTGGDKAPASG